LCDAWHATVQQVQQFKQQVNQQINAFAAKQFTPKALPEVKAATKDVIARSSLSASLQIGNIEAGTKGDAAVHLLPQLLLVAN
jgi:hypothetical protein